MTEIHISLIEKALTAKGFVAQDTHHTIYWLYVDGRKRQIHTYISHGQRRADDWLLGQMARQLKLTKTQFLALVECTMSGSEYVRIMRAAGHIQ
ncbi:MAG: hypothetical protein U0Q18_25245 [Bryobacteraceae bacterium]